MFTASFILMELTRRRRKPKGENKRHVRRQWLQSSNSRIPSDLFCESLHTMHINDHAGLILATQTPSYKRLNTTSTTTAVVNPVPSKAEKQAKNENDNNPNKDDDFTDMPRDELVQYGEDGDRLAVLQDEIATKKDKQRIVLEQIMKLEEKKRRFIRNTRLNQGKLRVSRRKRQAMEEDAQDMVNLRYNQLVDIEKEKLGMEEKLERAQDMAIVLAMQKEEKHRVLLQLIDNAPTLYRKESAILEERHQREVVRYQVVMGIFLALLAVLLFTYIARFGVTKEKPATREGIFY